MLLDEAQSSLIKETGKLRILVCYFVMRELIDDILRRPEKKTRVRLLQHTGVVIGITRRKYRIIQLFQRFHRLALRVFLAKQVICHSTIIRYLEFVTEQRRPRQLSQ